MTGLQVSAITSGFRKQTLSSLETVKVTTRDVSYGAYIKQRKQSAKKMNEPHSFRDQKCFFKKAAKVIEDTYMDQYVSGKLRPCASTWPQNVLGGGIRKHRNPAGVSLVHLKEGEEVEVTVGWE